MKIIIENKKEPITEFKIRHEGLNMNFNWMRENPPIQFSLELMRPNCCKIYIRDITELEELLYMLNKAKEEILGMAGHYKLLNKSQEDLE